MARARAAPASSALPRLRARSASANGSSLRMRSSAPRLGARFVDYTPVLAEAAGGMRPGLAYDGVHPTEQGYDAMATVIEPVLHGMKL